MVAVLLRRPDAPPWRGGSSGGRPPDAVVLDWMLPGMTGLEALRELQAHPATAQLPVVMATACDLPQNVSAAMDSGANGYLLKPFAPDDLLREVGAAIEPRFAPAVVGAA